MTGVAGTYTITGIERTPAGKVWRYYLKALEGDESLCVPASYVFANHLHEFYCGEIVKYASVRSSSKHQYKIVGLHPESGNAEIRHLVTGEHYITSLKKLCKV